jgi:hypothetical protein
MLELMMVVVEFCERPRGTIRAALGLLGMGGFGMALYEWFTRGPSWRVVALTVLALGVCALAIKLPRIGVRSQQRREGDDDDPASSPEMRASETDESP